ncbi:MAG: hypothetical protein ACHQ1D_00200 [Nitrososphaerales archaeon]
MNNKKKKKTSNIKVTACGGKGKKGCSWAGATIGITKMRIAA